MVLFGGDVGGNSRPLLSLTVDDPAASSATIFAGGLAVPELSTSITTTTTQTYNAPVEVLTDASFTSAGAGAAGNIMFASTLDTGFPSPGPANVMVRTAGTTTFGAEVGFNGLQSLTVAGVSGPDSGPIRINADSIFTFGSQTYGGAVTLGNDVIIGCGCGLSGDVTFLSTIDSAAVAPPWSLFVTASGSATFSGSIGATQPLALLEVQSPSIVFDAPTAQVVKVTGPGPFGDSVSLYGDFFTPEPAVITLGQNLSVDGGSGFVVFGGTIDGARTLTSTSSAGTIFLGNVGAGTPLTSITTQGGGSDGFGGVFPDPVAINTSGAQTYNNAVLLASDTTFTSTGAGASGNITFASTLDGFGPASLTVRTAGTTTFGDDIGVGFFPLLSLTVEGIGGAGSASGPIRIDAGAIFTDGSQTYGGAVTLGNNLFIDACGCTPGTVAFASTIDGDGVLGRSLTLLIGSGSTAVFSGDIGSSQPLSALDVSSPLVTFDAAVAQVVTTTGKQTYGGSAGDLVAVAAPTLTLSAGEFEFKGGADSVSGAGTTIVFQPFDAAASFGVGGGSVFLPSASIDALADGFSSIVIGRADGSGMATVLASTFKDPLIVRSTGAAGDVTVSGALTGFDGVSLLAGDLLAINAPVVTTPASGNGGPIIVEGSNVLFGPGGTLDSSGAGAGNAGEIFIHRLGTSSGNLVIGQNVSALGGATGGNGGVVTVINEDGIVDIQATIDVSRVNTSGADGTIQLKASGNVRSLGAGLLRGNTDGKLIAHSTGGSVELDPDPASGHEMATIALRSDDTTGEGRAAYHDRDALTIGTVGGVGTLAGYSGANAASVALLSGVRSIRGGAGTFAGSQIAIRAGRSADGALQVDQPVDATPLAAAMNGGLIVLEGRGGVAVNAPVSANGTGNSFGGAIFIHNVAAAAGDITIDADLSARGGAAGGSGGAVAVVNDNGAIALNATIDVTRGGVPLPFETGDGGIGLKATGDITDDDASGLLKANRGGRLQAWSTGGSIVLDRTLGHELATIFLRTDTTAGPGVITYHDRDDVALFALPFGTILVGTAFDAPAGSATIQTVAGGADGAVSIRAGKSATGSLRIEAVGPGLLGIDTRSSVAGRPGGSVVLEANGQGAGFVSGLSIGGPIDTSGNGNADAGEIFLHNVGAAGDITIAADVTLLGGAGGGRGGLLTVLNENGEVALAAGATIDVSRGDASGDDGAIQIEATGSIGGFPGAVSLLRGSTNGSLLAYSSGGSIGLAGVGQQMATIALVSDAGGIEYDASGSVAIGTAGGGGVLAGLDGRTASSVVARSGVRDGGLAGTPTVRVAAGFGGAGDLFVDAPVTTSAAHVFLEATAGTITLNAGVSAAGGGNTTFNGPVIVAVPLAIDSGTGTLTFNGSLTAGPNALALTGNEIDFNGGAASVSGASTLLLQPGAGSASIGLGGGAGTLDLSATDLGALAAGFSLVTIGGLADEGITTIGVAGSPAVAFRSPTLIRQGGAGRIELAGDITAADVPLTLDGILALTGNSTVAAGSGDVTFTRDIVGGFDLAVSSTGTTSFGGDVGSFSDPLATLTTDAGGSTRFAGTNQSQAVFTMGAQTYGDPVTLAPHTTFESSSGNVGFGSTLDGDAAGGVVTVRAATVTFSGNVGAFQPFGRFSVEADALVFNGASPQTLDVSATPVGSAGGALFDAPIVLEQSLTLNTGAYAVTFSRAIDGPGAFTLDSSGSVFFDAPVGEAAALASLTTNAGGMTAIGPVVVRTTGAQSFGDDVIVYGAGVTTFRTIAGGGVTFGGTLDGTDAGADSVAIDAGTASVVFGGAIGGDRPLASFDVSAGSISLQPLAATLRVNLTSDTMALGAIDAPGATVTLRNLTAGTAIELGGEPGPGLGLSSAELAGITAGTLRIGRTDAAASGAIEVVGDVAPNVADLHLISGAGVAGGGSIVVPALAIEAGGAVNLNGLLTNVGTLAAFAPGQSIVFGQLGAVSIGTVDGVTGVSAFAFDLEAGGIAQTAALTITGVSSFDADANAIVLMHAGNDFGGAVRLANGGANDVALADANDLAVAAAAVGRNLALTAGGTLTLPAIATPGTQTYTAVTTVLNGDVLASGLTVNGLTAINAPSVSTTGDQTYGDAVTVGANAVLESSGDVSFASTLDADAAANNRTLAINAPLGTVTFLGDIGAIQPFADFDVIAAPNTIVFGAALPQTVNVTGQGGNTATFTGGVRLDQDLTVNTGGATSNNVTFASAINGGAPGRALTLNAGSGNVSLADVGNLAPLGTLTTLSSLLALNGAASASQIFISANAVVAGPGGALNATLPFSGFAGDAALTLSGPASGGIFGTEAAPLAVNVPGLLVLSPNADNTLPIVWLRGAAAGKPQYEFYDSASHRPVYFNGRPPSAALIAPELDYEDLRRQAPELAFAGSDEAAAIDVRVAEPPVCTAASAEGAAALACETAAARE